ncbi:MAG: hypothetical protein JXR60_00875 [Bacteroidales bacterium]|nr:hypothetical protein [Bacteroidales bacterium]
MNKNVIFFILSFSFFSVAFAQKEIDKDSTQANYLIIAPEFTYHKAIDNLISPLLYKGSMAGIKLGYESTNNKRKYGFTLDGNLGLLKANTDYYEFSATQVNSELNVFYKLRMNKNSSKFSLYAGFETRFRMFFHYNPNLMNAALNLTSVYSNGLVASIHKDWFKKGKNNKIWFIKINTRDRYLKTSFELGLPILFANLRQPVSTISDFSDGQNLWSVESYSHVQFNKAFAMNTKTSIDYILHNGNALRFSYLWNIYKFEDAGYKYQSAYHMIVFSLLVKLN